MGLLPPYPEIHRAFKDGEVIPFLGAGASLGPRDPAHPNWAPPPPAVHLPTGGELTDYLALQSGFPNGEPKDLAKVAQYFHIQSGRPKLRRRLHDIFSPGYAPRPIHQLLASASKPQLIVTTNYDTLIEDAFAAAGRPYDLVVHGSEAAIGDRILHKPHGAGDFQAVEPKTLMIDLSKISVVYKIHGSCNRHDPKADQYVISEDDYIDFLSRMVGNTAIPAFCAEPFQCWPFLFLGYRLGDWNLRVVLNRVAPQVRVQDDVISWAIERSPSAVEERFWQARGVNVYTQELDAFVAELNKLGPI